jgi:hypothetical protein
MSSLSDQIMKHQLGYYLSNGLNKPLPDSEKKSGFFDLPQQDICRDKEHNPPSHICIPQGKGYRHVCPSCGKETVIIPPQVRL